MSELKSKAKELIGYSFLVALANDERISEAELHMMEKMALEDGQIDDDEREALRNIFARMDKHEVANAVHQEIDEFRSKHNL